LKDLDYSLACNKNLGQKTSSSSWCPGPGHPGQNGLKPTPLTTSPTKNTKSKTSHFFKRK